MVHDALINCPGTTHAASSDLVNYFCLRIVKTVCVGFYDWRNCDHVLMKRFVIRGEEDYAMAFTSTECEESSN